MTNSLVNFRLNLMTTNNIRKFKLWNKALRNIKNRHTRTLNHPSKAIKKSHMFRTKAIKKVFMKISRNLNTKSFNNL